MGVLARLGLEGAVPLWARVGVSGGTGGVVIASVTRNRDIHPHVRGRRALLVETEAELAADGAPGFAAVLVRCGAGTDASTGGLSVRLPKELGYIDDDDVVRIDPQARRVDVLYRRWSEHNSLLVTERCNSRCVMCSQPPIDRDDGYLVEDLLRAIPLISPDAREIGFTGGEPTLLLEGLLRLVRAMRDALPATRLHILSNGRLFAYARYAARVAAARHPYLVFGIPVYSDIPGDHDFVVQAKGAFGQTARGLLNLARYGIRVEIRVVIHRLTCRRLPRLAEFIARHFTFAEHVALMGLEPIGYARPNFEAVWIDPHDYQDELVAATHHLDRAGMNVSIYNHQTCVLDPALWRFAVKSISDWKNIYVPECEPCRIRAACGGFFASAHDRHSAHITPITTPPVTV